MRGTQWLAVSLTLALAAGESDPQARTKRNSGAIFFPGSFEPEPQTPVLELPENMDLNTLDRQSLSRINSIGNITAFADLFGIELTDLTLDLSVRTGGALSEEAIMANCKPELRTVHLDLPVEANTLFYPTCVRLEQCAGCCYGPLLTCRPTKTTKILLKVLKTQLNGSSRSAGRRTRSRRRRREAVPSYHEVEVHRHDQCTCGCKVQEQDCDPSLHTYFEGECSCVCKNKDDKAKCEQQGELKYWDNDSCNCYCRRPVSCNTGELFSPVSCKCEK